MMKPFEARIIEARARARKSHVRVYRNDDGTYRARSDSGNWYRLFRTREGFACDCDGYFFTGACKHLAALTRRSEREGWMIDRIAPTPFEPESQIAA
jgi:hypothetical protein